MRTTITATLVHHGGATDDSEITDEVHATSCVVTDTGIRTSIICGIEDEPRQSLCESCPFGAVVTPEPTREED